LRDTSYLGTRARGAPRWVTSFYHALMFTGDAATAAHAAGIDFETVQALREAEPDFAWFWDTSVRTFKWMEAGLSFPEAVLRVTEVVH
jgi:hypothetical protein